MTTQLERQLRQQRDALHFLWGFIHAAGEHGGNIRECTWAGCADARAALEEPVDAIAPDPTPKPDFVMPGQIWHHSANRTHRLKITGQDGTYAHGQPCGPTGQPTDGEPVHIRMDGPRALLGYIRDHRAERAELERQQ